MILFEQSRHVTTSVMKPILVFLFILSRYGILLSEGQRIEKGSYATVAGYIEKVFVDLEGNALQILKGGVVVNDNAGDGMCHIGIYEARSTYYEQVTYGVDCAKLIPTTMRCPPARQFAYNCMQTDIRCASDSLYYNGFVVIDGPVPG